MIRTILMVASVIAFMLCGALVVSQPDGTTWQLQLAYLFGFLASGSTLAYSLGWFDE